MMINTALEAQGQRSKRWARAIPALKLIGLLSQLKCYGRRNLTIITDDFKFFLFHPTVIKFKLK